MLKLIYALASIFLVKFYWEYTSNEIRQLWNGFELDDYKLLFCDKVDYGYRVTVQCINDGNYEHLKSFRDSFNKVYGMKTYFNNLGAMIKNVDIIIGLCFAVLGVALTVLARRITRIIRKRNDIDDNDTALIAIKVMALVCMLVAFLILVLQTLA